MFNSKFTWKDFFKGFLIGLIAYFLFFSPTLYNNTNVNVSIKYPGTWQVEKNPPPGGFVAFFGPKKKEIVVSFGMRYYMPDDGVNQIDYFEKALEEELRSVETKDETLKLIDKEETIIDGKEALNLVFEFEHEKTRVKMRQFWIKCNKKSLLVTGGGFSSDVLEEYNPIFEHMINSIRC